MLTAVSGRYSNTVTYAFDSAGRKKTEGFYISTMMRGTAKLRLNASFEYVPRWNRVSLTKSGLRFLKETNVQLHSGQTYTTATGYNAKGELIGYTARGELYQHTHAGTTIDTRV